MSAHRFDEMRVLVERWARVVDEVERGFTLTFDDYLNDLDLRHRIAVGELESAIDDATRAELVRTDARFRVVTEEMGDCVWGEENALEEGWRREIEWYYFRLPVRRPDDW